MKKEKLKATFRKVKQILGEKTGHIKESEKTSILSGEYSKINVKYSIVKYALKTTVKHLLFLFYVDCYKDDKKISHKNQLGMTIKCELRDIENSFLSKILANTSCCITDMEDHTIEMDKDIDEEVVAPLKEFLELFINLDKCKKELEDERINIDECKARLVSIKKGAAISGNTGPTTFDKIKNVEIEFMELSDRFENKQELMAIELLNYLAKNPAIADVYIKLLILESTHHKKNIETLNTYINDINDILSVFSFEPVYGMPLEELEEKYGQEISIVIECCLKFLLSHNCFETTGLFRIGAEGHRIKQLKNDINNGCFDLEPYEDDLHIICGALKVYLCELPEPLFPVNRGDDIVKISTMIKLDRLVAITKLLTEIPQICAKNILYLVSFFYVMAEHEETTRMSASSISIVVAPNLLFTDDMNKAMAYTQAVTIIFTDLIENFKALYPDWCENNEFKTAK